MNEVNSNSSCCSPWNSPRIALKIIALLLIGAIVIIAIIRGRIVNPINREVSVVGQGKVSYTPDIANVTLGVQVDKAPKADEALNQLNNKMNKVIDAVKKLGIPEEDIQTQNYSLSPQYDNVEGVSAPSGYSANQSLVIKVRNFKQGGDQASKVVAEATKAGANQVMGVSFDVSNVEDLKQQARLKAIEDSRSKAGSIAKAAGVRLGEVLGWWENIIQVPGPTPYSYYEAKGMMSSYSPSIPSGTQEVVMEISLNYKVKTR